MKNVFLKSTLLAIASVGLMVSGVLAGPFSSTGLVDPNFNNSWDSTTRTGTAMFEFYIDPAYTDVNVYGVSLEFESDIFDMSALDVSDFTVVNPSSGWSTTVTQGLNGYKFSISGNPTLTAPVTTANDPLLISFDYTLLSSEMYANANGSGWEWDEGQAWGIAYMLGGSDPRPYPAFSSGSTAPVPEPATMLLFGTGLAGLAGVVRRKKK